MKLSKVDWNKTPEIRWEKQICPLCSEPTGPESNCFAIGQQKQQQQQRSKSNLDFEEEGGEDGISSAVRPNTVEMGGQLYPVYSKQCIFRRYSNYFVDLNFPISKALAIIIVSVEGVEQFFVETKYRGLLTIGNQFDETDVKREIVKVYQEYVLEHRAKLSLAEIASKLNFPSEQG